MRSSPLSYLFSSRQFYFIGGGTTELCSDPCLVLCSGDSPGSTWEIQRSNWGQSHARQVPISYIISPAPKQLSNVLEWKLKVIVTVNAKSNAKVRKIQTQSQVLSFVSLEKITTGNRKWNFGKLRWGCYFSCEWVFGQLGWCFPTARGSLLLKVLPPAQVYLLRNGVNWGKERPKGQRGWLLACNSPTSQV